MQKLKIEEDFAEKTLLIQLKLEEDRERAESAKQKYENENAKLEQEHKKLEQLQMEIQERGEQIAAPANINKHSSNFSKPLNNDKSTSANKPYNSSSSKKDFNNGFVTDKMTATVLSVSSNSEQATVGLHESISSLQQTSTLTSTELVEREKQLLLRQEKLDAMQVQLSGKLSGNHIALDSDNSEILRFVAEKEKIEQQRILMERAKFSAESKER